MTLQNARQAGQYVVHIAGPDDVIEHPNELSALQDANKVNKFYLKQLAKHGDNTPLCIAVVKTKKEIEAESA